MGDTMFEANGRYFSLVELHEKEVRGRSKNGMEK
jgi:hypothetical protein